MKEIETEDTSSICARAVSRTDPSLVGTLVVAHKAEIRPPKNAMLTFPAASDPCLDAFFEAIVELLLERVAQPIAEHKETESHDHNA